MTVETILPHELPGALERAGDGLKVLSLDCFDTLLWRDCYAPTDLFSGLSKVTLAQRQAGEEYARKAQVALKNQSEVLLEAIYAQAMPSANARLRAEAVAEEVETEAKTCFAFAPTVALMREAKSRGLKVIIVSDTYLSARQLRGLIEQAAGKQVVDLIDRIFVSCEAGISKSQGLLQKALSAIKVKPSHVLHIGDNKSADFDASRAIGVPALHLVQFGDDADQRLRFERGCHQIAGDVQDAVRALMPHRAPLAQLEPTIEEPAHKLGASVLGPVFHAFDMWLRKEAEALARERGGKVHWLFMLRDGHLPHIIHQIGGDVGNTARVEISRFVAIAASLTSREAYERQYGLELGLKPSTLARQMLFEEDEIECIIGEDETPEQMLAGTYRLRDELRSGKRQKITRRRARERADRLIAHVKARVNPKPGDTLMLVDLGYNGSAQDRVDHLLSQAFGVHVAGRYLLCREKTASGLDKKGLFDERHYDAELLAALCGNVAVIEQLATCALGSVEDFTDEGEPLRQQASVKGAQSIMRERVQEGAQLYAKTASQGCVVRQSSPHHDRALRESALGALMRFLFLPSAREIETLKSFEHDVNLGSDRMVPLFDASKAHEGMRRRGLHYMVGSQRMFLPAEIEGEDIHTRLSFLVQKRFGLGLTYRDTGQQSIAIPAFFMGAKDATQSVIRAEPTHEGFYTARLPIPPGVGSIGLGVGSVFEWFELKSISKTGVATLGSDCQDGEQIEELSAEYDAIEQRAPGICECTGTGAFVLVNTAGGSDENDPQMIEPQMIEIVMRPLIRRKATSSMAAAGQSDAKASTREKPTTPLLPDRQKEAAA